MIDWLVPTARASTWQPLAVAAAALAAVTMLDTAGDSWPARHTDIVAAALAAAVVAGLGDVAAELLAAVPTTVAVRHGRLLLLLVPAAATLWLGYQGVGRHLDPSVDWSVETFIALTCCGVAVAVWTPAALAVPAGAAAPLLWVAVPAFVARSDQGLAERLALWVTHPWLVVVAAVTAIWIGVARDPR